MTGSVWFGGGDIQEECRVPARPSALSVWVSVHVTVFNPTTPGAAPCCVVCVITGQEVEQDHFVSTKGSRK